MQHEHHQWLEDVNRSIVEAYEREQEAARQASKIQEVGHGVESVWDEVLSDWLPPDYEIRKRKYLLLETEDGPAKSREVDLVVFHPHYPMPLRKKRDVLASGVAAAFSVKRTLNRIEIGEAYEQAAMIRQGMKIREGTPRDHLAPPMFFGLLAESHSWKKADDPKLKVKALVEEFDKEVRTPRDGLDMLCVADLGYWVRSTSIVKGETLRSMRMPLSLAQNMPPEIVDLMSGQDIVMSGLRHDYDDEDPLSPLAHLIGSLWGKLAINDKTLRPLADGFRITKTYPDRGGLTFRRWPLVDVTNEHIAKNVKRGFIPNADWQYLF